MFFITVVQKVLRERKVIVEERILWSNKLENVYILPMFQRFIIHFEIKLSEKSCSIEIKLILFNLAVPSLTWTKHSLTLKLTS